MKFPIVSWDRVCTFTVLNFELWVSCFHFVKSRLRQLVVELNFISCPSWTLKMKDLFLCCFVVFRNKHQSKLNQKLLSWRFRIHTRTGQRVKWRGLNNSPMINDKQLKIMNWNHKCNQIMASRGTMCWIQSIIRFLGFVKWSVSKVRFLVSSKTLSSSLYFPNSWVKFSVCVVLQSHTTRRQHGTHQTSQEVWQCFCWF